MKSALNNQRNSEFTEEGQKRRGHRNVIGRDAVVREQSIQRSEQSLKARIENVNGSHACYGRGRSALGVLSTGRNALANTSMAAAKSCAVRCRLALARRLVPSSI